MRDPYQYGLPGDVSYTPQNRLRELYYGAAPNARLEKTMRAVPSGHHMAPIGKTVQMAGLRGRGMGALVAVPFSEVTGRPVMRAAYESHKLGIGTSIQMAALGDAVADRNACMAVTGAMVGGSGVAQQMHTQSGGTDQGWTTGISIFSALAATGAALCTQIQTSGTVTPAPAGATPPPLPPATSSLSTQPAAVTQQSTDFLAGVPSWAIFAGAAAAGGLIAAVAFGK